MDPAGILLIAMAIGLGILLVVAIARGWLRAGRGGVASLTAMHDFQPVDKQNATEIVIEQKAGKRWTEQESGDAGGKKGPDREEGAGRRQTPGPCKGDQTHEP